MKVLVVSNTYPPADISGVGSLAQELLEGLADQIEIEVLTRTAPPDAPGVLATGGPKLLFPLLAGWHARLNEPGTIVHVNESDGVVIALLIALRRLLRRPTPQLAATFQVSYRREAYEVRPVLADGQPVSRPTGSERVFKHFRAPLLELAGKLTARLADQIVACSRFTVDELEADYGIERASMVPIANGVRVSGPQPDSSSGTQERDPEAPLQALYVGRLRTRKAVAVALAALRQPQAANVHLTIVGNGEQDDALRQRAAEWDLQSRVTFAGRQTREQVAEHYRRADVFLLPSTYEGFPVAILEAMAQGLPIVATSVAGVPEAFVDGGSGLLIEPESATAIAEALGSLEADRRRCQAMGVAARERVASEFSIEIIGQQYLELWQQMAKRPNADATS